MRLKIKLSVPHSRVMSAVITHDIESMQPGRQSRSFHLPLVGNGCSASFIRIIVKISDKPHFCQGYGHPERRIIMRITIFIKEMIQKLYPTQEHLSLFISFDFRSLPFLQIIAPMRKIGSGSIRKRVLPLRMQVSKSATQSYFYTLNGIQQQQTQVAVKTIQQPNLAQGCTGDKRTEHITRSITLTERMPISTQTIIAHITQSLYQLMPIGFQTSGKQKLGLLLIRKMRFGILHKQKRKHLPMCAVEGINGFQP